MSRNEPLRRRHHFVPKHMLRSWAVNGEVLAYFWDQHTKKLAWKRRGPASLCNEIDLLILNEHPQGQDALERVFFQDIDTRAALIRQKLLQPGQLVLDAEERSQFARFLLSFAARHPEAVKILREDGQRHLIEGIDNDPEIQATLPKYGVTTSASEFMRSRGVNFEDRAVAIIQKLTDSRRVGSVLINMEWSVLHLTRGSFLLGDRPLFRDRGFDDPLALWALPLSPTAVFFASANPGRLETLKRLSPSQLMRQVNVVTAIQADRYLMAVDRSHESWIGKYLSRGSQARKLTRIKSG